uniref:Uncharacterized protein n=1 Tax=Panagrolaimus superbus TaxID=310955 RepID=A0A914YSV6_9BILA
MVIPLRVQNTTKGGKCDIIVFFVVDTGSPEITLSKETCAKLIGKGCRPLTILVQGKYFPFIRSKTSGEAFQNVNLLGTNFFLQSNTSLIFSPYKFIRPGIESSIFYLTSLKFIKKVQKLASTPNQNPNIFGKLGLESRTEEIRNFDHTLAHPPAALSVGMNDCVNLSRLEVLIYDFEIVSGTSSCQSCDIIVFFVVHTGASKVSFSKEAHGVLTKGGADPFNVLVQDESFTYILSENVRADLKDVNLLGTDFFFKTETSLIFSPYYHKFNRCKIRMFYITPFTLITGVKEIAERQQQNANFNEKLKVVCPTSLSQSDIRSIF